MAVDGCCEVGSELVREWVGGLSGISMATPRRPQSAHVGSARGLRARVNSRGRHQYTSPRGEVLSGRKEKVFDLWRLEANGEADHVPDLEGAMYDF